MCSASKEFQYTASLVHVQYVSPTPESFLGRPGGFIPLSALSPSLEAGPPLVVLLGNVVMPSGPLFRLASPGGPGMALLSRSPLPYVFLRLGVAKSSSRDSSRSICETLWEWP